MYSMSTRSSGYLKHHYNTVEVQACVECLSYAKIEFSLVLFLRLAAEHISLILSVFNVNELIWVLEASIEYKGSASMP